MCKYFNLNTAVEQHTSVNTHLQYLQCIVNNSRMSHTVPLTRTHYCAYFAVNIDVTDGNRMR